MVLVRDVRMAETDLGLRDHQWRITNLPTPLSACDFKRVSVPFKQSGKMSLAGVIVGKLALPCNSRASVGSPINSWPPDA